MLFSIFYQGQKHKQLGTSLVAQWLRLRAPNAGGPSFDPWSGNKMPPAATKTQRNRINK